MAKGIRLPRSFYDRDVLQVAQDLLGKFLVRRLDGRILSGMIVETEAYNGPHDLACHASKGRTARTELLFGEPGYAYVYMIYGVYFCLNAVTSREGYPAAVLIRAIEPGENVQTMRRLRNDPARETDIANGPGKLCVALDIDKRLNGEDLVGRTLWVEDRHVDPGLISAGPRIGIDYAGEYKDKPWRFFISGNPHVSRRKQ